MARRVSAVSCRFVAADPSPIRCVPLAIVPVRFAAYLVRLDPVTNKIERRIKAGLRQPIAVAFMKDMWIVDAFGNSLIRASMLE